MSAPDDTALAALAAQVGAKLLQGGLRAVTAESCTGGLVAKLLTDVPGSSNWFECGYVTYSNEAKQRDLGVDPDTLKLHGAVSEQTVMQMAAGALARSGADRAVAVSGVAGPAGGTAAHPLGGIWFALASQVAEGPEIRTSHHQFAGDRDAIRRLSAAVALQLLMDP